MLKKRGQTWSFDLIIAVILFIVVVAVFYAFLASRNSDTGAQEQQDYAFCNGSPIFNNKCDRVWINHYFYNC